MAQKKYFKYLKKKRIKSIVKETEQKNIYRKIKEQVEGHNYNDNDTNDENDFEEKPLTNFTQHFPFEKRAEKYILQ